MLNHLQASRRENSHLHTSAGSHTTSAATGERDKNCLMPVKYQRLSEVEFIGCHIVLTQKEARADYNRINPKHKIPEGHASSGRGGVS